MFRTSTPTRSASSAAATLITSVLVLLAFTSLAEAKATSRDDRAVKPTVVLVHGAWADGSSWARVTRRLQREGYTVKVPPNPLRGLAGDSAYLESYLATVKGPVVLAGHSYGGAVITNAATLNPTVKALVYVDAYIPDEGETVLGLTGAKPGSALADPAAAFDFVPFTGPAGDDVDLYVKPSVFPSAFAADLRPRRAALLAATQRPLAASALQSPSGAPAWKTVPSWALIGTEDKVLPPAEQTVMTDRAHATTVRVRASHLSLISQPDAVERLIIDAADTTD